MNQVALGESGKEKDNVTSLAEPRNSQMHIYAKS